jgi:Zn-finger nucleic acid-binding protein
MQCRYCLSLAFPYENPLAVDRITPMGGEIDAACPCCSQPLLKGMVEDQPALYCRNCYGMLVRNDMFGVIINQRRSRRQSLPQEDVKPIDPAEFQRQIQCPNCHGHMETHPYYGPGNVVIDSCAACRYVWLDHAELSRIERSAGGKEPQISPVTINSDGQPTTVDHSPAKEPGELRSDSPLAMIVDLLF